MTPSEVDILLQAIEALRGDIQELDHKLEGFRSYADQTYVRKDTLQSKDEVVENIWKKRDRILARLAFLVSLAAAVSAFVSMMHQ